MTANSTSYRGGCHCNAIGYQFETALAPTNWSIRACQCAFCRAHGALSTSDPDGRVTFTLGSADLHRYRFALRTADFLLCKKCGVYVGAVIDVADKRYAIINTRTLQPQPEDLADVEPISYAGEDSAGRISRRAERWTPVVD